MISSRFSILPLALTLAATAIIAGCGSGDSGGGASGTTSAQSGADRETVKVFLTSGEQFNPVERQVPPDSDVPLAATKELLEGPSEGDANSASKDAVQTTIPPDVKVKDLKIDDSGEAVVELSDEFLGDIPARPAKRTASQQRTLGARAAQVTYTLTQFDKVNSTRVVSGGVSVTPDDDRADFSQPAKKPKPPKDEGGGDRRSTTTLNLQQKLADLGYLAGNDVDGIAGYQTQQAVTAFQAWEGLDRDGVAGPATNAALSNARRPRPSTKSGPKRFMEVHISKGVLLMVKDGRTQRAVHVSPGAAATPTRIGRFRVFRKELMSWSVPFSSWLPYASYFDGGIAFHQYADVPPYPASHGCVRVPEPEAKRVYRFAAINRVVIVRQ